MSRRTNYPVTTINRWCNGTAKNAVPLELKKKLSNIAKAIKGGKVYFAPINCGNVHNNYESALHQNRRLRSLYGVIFELSTVYTTSLQILDTVELSFYDKQGSERIINKSVSGGYLIIDKGIFVTASGTYYEKFRLARQGNNSLPNSQGS